MPNNENRPGNRVRLTGKYEILDPNGNPIGEYRKCTRGSTFPPTPKKDESYVLEDNNKRGQRKK